MQRLFITHRRVEFSDTDMAGIAHFSNFFRYMEEAEHAFLRSIGKNVVLHDERGTLGFPKLEAHCQYKRPAIHDAEMTIELKVTCNDGKTIRHDCRVYQASNDDETDLRMLAEGYLHVACCRFPADGLPYPIPIPDDVLAAIESA